MMPRVSRWAAIAACAVALAVSAGCGSSPTRFYALSALPQGGGPARSMARSGPMLGIGPVSVPERLNRPQIVTWVNDNMLHLAEFDRWAAPLHDSIARVLAENLSLLLSTDHATVFPWPSDIPIDYEVRVDVSRLEGTLGRDCSLIAQWFIHRRADMRTKGGRSNHTEPAGDSYTTLVAAQSRLVAALSRDIATALGAGGW